MISIAFNGQELGQFSSDEVAAMLESGQIDQTAHYWLEGMTEWRSITEIIAAEAKDIRATFEQGDPSKEPQRKRDEESPNQSHVNFLARRGLPTRGMTKLEVATVFERIKAEEAYEVNRITERQKAFLDYHGVKYTDKTTKAEASDIISHADQRFPDSQWNTYKHLIRPDLYAKPAPSLSAKDELKEAKERLTSAQEELKKLRSSNDSGADDIESAKQEVEDIREEVEHLKAQIEDDKLAAQEGTDETSSFVEAWGEGYYEPTGEDVERFKKVVKKPTKTQYKSLREKLNTDLGLDLSVLTVDQFLCLYIQQYPEALKEPYKSQGFPALSLQIPKTYQQQLQLEQASSQGSRGSTAAAKKGCLGLVLLTAAPLGALFVVAALFLWCLY